MMKHLRLAVPVLAMSILLPAAAPGDAVVPCDTDVIAEGQSETYSGMATVIVDPSDAGAAGGAHAAEIATVGGTASEEALKVAITATMTWDLPGDLELRAYDADGKELGASTDFNPQGELRESLIISMDACETVTFVVENYAGVPGTPVELEVSVEGKYPRKR